MYFACVCVCVCIHKILYVCILLLCSVAKSCPTLQDPITYSLAGSPVHGISQARILEWVAIPFSSRSSQSRDRTCILGCFKFAWSGNLVSLLPTNQMHSLGFSDCSQAPLCIVKSYNIVPKLQRSWLIPKEVKYLEKKKISWLQRLNQNQVKDFRISLRINLLSLFQIVWQS